MKTITSDYIEYNGIKYAKDRDYFIVAECVGVPSDGHLVIPETVEGLPVKWIKWDVFKGRKGIISVDMPSVELVFMQAFHSCTSLVSVNAPKLRTVMSCGFSKCSSLVSAHMPLVTTVEEAAFYACSSLKSIYLPCAEHIGDEAFYKCSSLRSVYLGPKSEYMGEGAFAFCSPDLTLYCPAGTVRSYEAVSGDFRLCEYEMQSDK